MNINPFEIMKNAQKIQEQIGTFQEKLGQLKVTGSSGGGMVEIDLNGKMDALAVRISDEAMEDKEMLQDLCAAAMNNAMERVKETVNREAGAMLPGGSFPGITGFPVSPGTLE